MSRLDILLWFFENFSTVFFVDFTCAFSFVVFSEAGRGFLDAGALGVHT